MDETVISADSHVIEPHDLWQKALGKTFGDAAPKFPKLEIGESFQHHPGGTDPKERVKEMAEDGVSAEVLYPTNALSLFRVADQRLQEACFRVYNDWLIEYCSVAPDRLIGVACISVYDIDAAVKELERCQEAGMKGVEIWEVPRPDLPFHSDHYEPLWAALAEIEMPLSFHILTGYNANRPRWDIETYRAVTNTKTQEALDAVFEFVFYGILERYPKLKLVTVEHEMGFWPWTLQQWDYYHSRFKDRIESTLTLKPSEYAARQLYTTFFNDRIGAQSISFWPSNNAMWSNDYPHENSPWPNSRKIIERDLGDMPVDVRAKIVSGNVTELYQLDAITSVAN